MKFAFPVSEKEEKNEQLHLNKVAAGLLGTDCCIAILSFQAASQAGHFGAGHGAEKTGSDLPKLSARIHRLVRQIDPRHPRFRLSVQRTPRENHTRLSKSCNTRGGDIGRVCIRTPTAS